MPSPKRWVGAPQRAWAHPRHFWSAQAPRIRHAFSGQAYVAYDAADRHCSVLVCPAALQAAEASTSQQEQASSSSGQEQQQQQQGSGAEDVKQKVFSSFKSGFSRARHVDAKGVIQDFTKEIRDVFKTADNIRSATRMYTGPVMDMSTYDGSTALQLVQQQQTSWEKLQERVSGLAQRIVCHQNTQHEACSQAQHTHTHTHTEAHQRAKNLAACSSVYSCAHYSACMCAVQLMSVPLFAKLSGFKIQDTAAYKKSQETIEDLKEKYETSDHPMVHKVRHSHAHMHTHTLISRFF